MIHKSMCSIPLKIHKEQQTFFSAIHGIILILLVSAIGSSGMILSTFLAVAIHEFSHIAAIRILAESTAKKDKSLFYGKQNGFRIRAHTVLSYKREIVVCFAGIAANLTVFLLLLPFQGSFLCTLRTANLITAVSNLLPMKGYDGYRMIKEWLDYTEKSSTALHTVSFALCVVLTFFSLWLIGKTNAGYWIFFACIFLSENE